MLRHTALIALVAILFAHFAHSANLTIAQAQQSSTDTGTELELDLLAYWPLADDLIDRVVRNRKVSRKDSGKKLFMGKWPDGKPFPRASIAPDPCLPEIESN